MIPVVSRSKANFKLEWVYATRSICIVHFYCLAVEANFYNNLVEGLPEDPATQVQFPAGTGWNFLLFNIKVPTLYVLSECKIFQGSHRLENYLRMKGFQNCTGFIIMLHILHGCTPFNVHVQLSRGIQV